MKKVLIIILSVLLLVSALIFIPACKKNMRVENMLTYQREQTEHDIIYYSGESEYDMRLTLKEHNGEYPFRDGSVEIVSGALEGVLFEMKSGEVKMKAGGFEYALTETESPSIYALFAAFGIEAASFTDLQTDASGTEIAYFEGKYNFTLLFENGGSKPSEIIAYHGENNSKIKFKT